MQPTDRLYTIQEISRELNLPKSTIRFWEKRLEGLIQPIRSKGGQRRYLPEHIKTLCRIKELKQQGVSLSDIQRRLLKEKDLPLTDLSEQHIHYLADRVAGLVKQEIFRYLSESVNQERSSRWNLDKTK